MIIDIEKIKKSANIIGSSDKMDEMIFMVGQVANTDISVLVTGASGAGKEMVAKAVHKNSKRKHEKLITVNCAAIPSGIIESELFGHKKGAYTDASDSRKGYFETANKGTIFLDEIGDMPLDSQTRLLRVLSNKEFYRVGGDTPIKVEVRILTATHQNLENLVTNGTFREDLFYRLNVIRIEVPPLRKRLDDISDLSTAFLKAHSDALVEPLKILSNDALKKLKQFDWPGNVRQLENVCYWLTLMAPSQNIGVNDLPSEVLENKSTIKPTSDWISGFKSWLEDLHDNYSDNLLKRIEPEIDKAMIEFALDKSSGKKQDAAKMLGLGRNTLAKKLKNLDISD